MEGTGDEVSHEAIHVGRKAQDVLSSAETPTVPSLNCFRLFLHRDAQATYCDIFKTTARKMDIAGWLHGITHSSPSRVAAAHAQHTPDEAAARVPGRGPRPVGTRKRKHSSEDISIIRQRAPGHAIRDRRSRRETMVRSPVPASSSTTSEHSRSSPAVLTATISEGASASETSRGRRMAQKTYERRPRHKTKADKYLPKEKRQKKDRSGHPVKRTKARKKHATVDSQVVVQRFKAKNVANARLTVSMEIPVSIHHAKCRKLESNDKAGLYKQGRASRPVRGRGCTYFVECLDSRCIEFIQYLIWSSRR